MKKLLSLTLTGIVALSLAANLFSQANMVSYMKVKPGKMQDYLEVEKEWKKIHQARLEKGHIIGWQLWHKMYGGAGDEYQYIVINWYKNLANAEKGGWEIIDELYTKEEKEKLFQKTLDSRVTIRTDAMRLVTQAEVTKPTNYIMIASMRPKQGMRDEYIQMEKDIFKPVWEEVINQGGNLSHWSLWNKWMYKEGDVELFIVQGYNEFSDINRGINAEEILKKVHPDMSMDEMRELVGKTRDSVARELWRLVDSVMPEPEEE